MLLQSSSGWDWNSWIPSAGIVSTDVVESGRDVGGTGRCVCACLGKEEEKNQKKNGGMETRSVCPRR